MAAPNSAAPERVESVKTASVRVVPPNLAFVKLLPVNKASVRLADAKLAPMRSAPARSAPDRSQPVRFAPGAGVHEWRGRRVPPVLAPTGLVALAPAKAVSVTLRPAAQGDDSWGLPLVTMLRWTPRWDHE